MPDNSVQVKRPVNAIAAAVLFGVSTPLAKLLLGDINPILFASFLYLGSGMGLLSLGWVRHFEKTAIKEAGLDVHDYPWLACATLAGGVIAPICLLYGLQATPAATASLLLNFEIVATVLIGYTLFSEFIGRRILLAITIITVAGIILSWNTTGQPGLSLATAGILFACVFWGIDNNLTRKISEKDPFAIATVKGLCAGSVSLALAMLTHAAVPGPLVIAAVMGIGFLTYGLSVAFFIRSLRDLGVARTSAYFAAAPFVGSIASVLIFRDIPDMQFFIALPLFLAGLVLVISERHIHRHAHERMVHMHRHLHDDLHNHPPPDGDSHEHTHEHENEPIVHEHPHVPDIHHRHKR